MARFNLVLIFTFLVGSIGYSQDLFLISSGGAYSEGTGGSVSWSVGEPMIKTASSFANDITQGFQQGNIYVTGLEELKEFKISVYPNPTSEIVNVTCEESSILNLFDMSGRLVHTYSLTAGNNTIDVNSFERGTYTMTFVKNDNQSKVVKLILM